MKELLEIPADRDPGDSVMPLTDTEPVDAFRLLTITVLVGMLPPKPAPDPPPNEPPPTTMVPPLLEKVTG
jgi:hypothetical protein